MTFSAEDLEAARKLFAGPCDFAIGAADLTQLPEGTLPEVAFAGRSNVGKSSLINALTGRGTLARTSNTPGRTQQLNYFNLGNRLFLVDMPGYGFARVSHSQREAWDDLIFDYLRGRATLRTVFLMVDSRHGLKDVDLHLMGLLDKAAVAYRVILTKCDKAEGSVREEVERALKKHPSAFPEALETSAQQSINIDILRATISALQ